MRGAITAGMRLAAVTPVEGYVGSERALVARNIVSRTAHTLGVVLCLRQGIGQLVVKRGMVMVYQTSHGKTTYKRRHECARFRTYHKISSVEHVSTSEIADFQCLCCCLCLGESGIADNAHHPCMACVILIFHTTVGISAIGMRDCVDAKERHQQNNKRPQESAT